MIEQVRIVKQEGDNFEGVATLNEMGNRTLINSLWGTFFDKILTSEYYSCIHNNDVYGSISLTLITDNILAAFAPFQIIVIYG